MEQVESVLKVSEGISNYGIMIVICSVFIVLSLLMWVGLFKWFKGIINNTLTNNKKVMDELLNKTDAQNELLNDIADSMRPTSLLQIKNISNTCFDLSVEKVCRIIKKVKEENNIINKEATKKKIRTLLCNLHENRNSRFDNFKFNGNTLTHYTNPQWIDWVEEIVMLEVYAETQNDARTFTNTEAVYEKIKLDFYHNLTNG